MKHRLFLASLAISAVSMAVAVPVWAADAPVKLANGTLVAANGMTLYTFEADKVASGKSACNGPCAAVWPPLLAVATEQLAGPYSASLSVVTRDDGARQVTYKGKPVYFFTADQKSGDRLGDNFKDVWHVIKD